MLGVFGGNHKDNSAGSREGKEGGGTGGVRPGPLKTTPA